MEKVYNIKIMEEKGTKPSKKNSKWNSKDFQKNFAPWGTMLSPLPPPATDIGYYNDSWINLGAESVVLQWHPLNLPHYQSKDLTEQHKKGKTLLLKNFSLRCE